MPKQFTHGGKRPGAGRKTKWSLDEVLAIGLACEKRWQNAKAASLTKKKSELTSIQSDLEDTWRIATQVPISERKAWLNSEEGKAHLGDVREEIVTLNEQRPDTEPTNALFTLSAKPPIGTRKQIIEEIAVEFGITLKQTDTIWQRYRRLERQFKLAQLDF